MPLFASLRTRAGQITDFTERYLLSAFYLWLAFRAVDGVVNKFYLRPEGAFEHGVWLVSVIREVDVFAISFLIGLLLLRSRPPVERPREWKEVLVPLAVSTFFMVYSLHPLLPQTLREPLAPLSVQVPCAFASLALGAAGSLLALWGVIALGRSFGIFVAVRKVVLAGPYRYVRHPIYSGYLLIWIGQVLVNLSIGIALFVAIHVLLMIYRARLEERRLAEASPEYRAYREQTGFLFPKVGLGKPG
jgi:protein-S-isoprenylcysteine O-methyltransferase Ste14